MPKTKTPELLRESVASQLEDLRQLKDGWLEGEGKAPTQNGLTWVADRFESFLSANETLPYIYPTFEGGVRAEWSIKSWELSLEINLDDHTGFWHVFHLDSEKEEEKTLDLNRHEEWTWVFNQLVSKEENGE